MWRYNIGTNEWTWMKGSNVMNDIGSLGVKGVETAANLPSARMSYTQWKGQDGNFYIFGGGTFTSSYNDVWKYNLQSNNWTWVSGSGLTDHDGIYSTKCNPNNIDFPHARMENSTIAFGENKSHLLWSFGGFQKVNLTNSYNDLWIYNMNNSNWTWVSGYDYTVLNTTGDYGVKGVASPTNVIPARGGACIWKDNNDNLYFFGGMAADSTLPTPPGHPFALGLKNDLWRFTPDTSCFWEPALNTNVHDASKENSLKIYPNPTDGKFTLSSDVKLNNAMLIIRNNIGQEIYQLPNLKGKSYNLDITTYPSGIYFVQLIEKDYHAHFKIVKQ